MNLISAFFDLFRDACPERQKKENLRRARLELEEAEIGVEDYTARRDKLKERIARLEGELNADGRPARSSVQAPHPGPRRENVGGFAVPDPIMRGHKATLA